MTARCGVCSRFFALDASAAICMFFYVRSFVCFHVHFFYEIHLVSTTTTTLFCIFSVALSVCATIDCVQVIAFLMFFVLLSGRGRRCQRLLLSFDCFDIMRFKHANENPSRWQGIRDLTSSGQCERGFLECCKLTSFFHTTRFF